MVFPDIVTTITMIVGKNKDKEIKLKLVSKTKASEKYMSLDYIFSVEDISYDGTGETKNWRDFLIDIDLEQYNTVTESLIQHARETDMVSEDEKEMILVGLPGLKVKIDSWMLNNFGLSRMGVEND